MSTEWHRGAYTISTNRTRLDLDMIYTFLAHSYWAEDIPRALVQRSIDHSLPFGLYAGARQIGF
jgi:hypothetical protein